MASAAAAKATATSYSISNADTKKLGFSHKLSIKAPFYSNSSSPRLVAVNFNNPNIDSVKMNKTAHRFELGGGSAESLNDSPSPSAAIDFLQSGWLNHGIKGPGSIAVHMHRMSLMALIADDAPGINRERCIKIAIVHDIAEAIVGDITPSDVVPKHEKSRMEQEALDEMCKVLGGGMREHVKILDEFFLSTAGKFQTKIGK